MEYKRMRELNATIIVQRYWRGYAARSAYQKAHRIILKLQVGCERFKSCREASWLPAATPNPLRRLSPR